MGLDILSRFEASYEWRIKEMDDLKSRVEQFMTMSLPGQPPGMHMGTSILIYDLWREVERLRKATKETTSSCDPAA